MMLPNEHWTEDSTKKLIDKWLQDGKLTEIERKEIQADDDNIRAPRSTSAKHYFIP
jgi:polyhydroxyalkanoate synthesis regulator phasin